MKLYHVNVFLPADLKDSLPRGIFKLCYTDHAKRAAASDRYGQTPLPDKINTFYAKVIEVETDTVGRVNKVVYRVPVSFTMDLCLAVIPQRNSFVVKTVWQNESSDAHKTLNVYRYERG